MSILSAVDVGSIAVPAAQAGGRVLAEGAPEAVARVRKSHTGQALKDVLRPGGAKSAANGKKLPGPGEDGEGDLHRRRRYGDGNG